MSYTIDQAMLSNDEFNNISNKVKQWLQLVVAKSGSIHMGQSADNLHVGEFLAANNSNLHIQNIDVHIFYAVQLKFSITTCNYNASFHQYTYYSSLCTCRKSAM